MVDVKELWKEVESGIEHFSKRAIDLSDWLAKNPELSEKEFEASKRHAAFLEEAGYDVQAPFMGLATSFFSTK